MLSTSTNLLRAVARSNPRLLLNKGFHFETYVCTPPRVRIPLVEKLVHCAIIGTSCLATPMWVLYHLKEYRGDLNKAE